MHSLSSEVETTTCDKIVQAGYQIAGRVVRPAMVTVVDPDPAGSAAGAPAATDDDEGAGATEAAAAETPEAPEGREPGQDS
jgi:hypothetical protein